MKMIVAVILAFVALSHALNEEHVAILKSQFVQQPEGSYQFGYESADGSVRDETGEVKEVLDEEKKPHKVVTVRGFYSYPNENGEPETVNYFADETGYHAEGKSIPQASSRK